jgi:hypothetical protein
MEELGLTTLLLDLVESNGTWKAVAVGGLILAWRWWKGVQAHLCSAIPDAIAIAKKVAEDGLDIRLKVHMCDDEEDKEGE